MRPKTLLTGLLAASLTLGAAANLRAQDDEPTPLQAAMGQMQGSQRAMRRLVGDPGAHQDALLRALSALQEGALAAYGLPPAAPEGEDPHAWRIGFRRQLLKVLDAALECELATHAGDGEALGAAYARLGEFKKGGHDRFQDGGQ